MNKTLIVGFTVHSDVSDGMLLKHMAWLRDYTRDMTLETVRNELYSYPFGIEFVEVVK